MGKRANKDLHNIKQKDKERAKRTALKTGMNSGAEEW